MGTKNEMGTKKNVGTKWVQKKTGYKNVWVQTKNLACTVINDNQRGMPIEKI